MNDEFVAAVRRAYMVQRARHPEQFAKPVHPHLTLPLTPSRYRGDDVGKLLADVLLFKQAYERLEQRAERQLYK